MVYRGKGGNSGYTQQCGGGTLHAVAVSYRLRFIHVRARRTPTVRHSCCVDNLLNRRMCLYLVTIFMVCFFSCEKQQIIVHLIFKLMLREQYFQCHISKL